MWPIVGIIFSTILSLTCADEQLMCIACGFPKVVKDLIKSQKGLEIAKAYQIANSHDNHIDPKDHRFET